MSLFSGGKSDSPVSLRYSCLAKKMATAKTFVTSMLVTPERLPPTTSATNLHSRRTYLHVMEWLGNNGGMQPTEWGWAEQGDKLVTLMTKPCAKQPRPSTQNGSLQLLCRMQHNDRCGCRKHALECTRACDNCKDDDWDKVAYKAVSDDAEDEA